jgi:fructose-1,6-bisphosphatase/inositol monophosphatase family enzyme
MILKLGHVACDIDDGHLTASLGERAGALRTLRFHVVDEVELLRVLAAAADAVADSLRGLADWGLAGTRPGQYRSDLVADEVAVRVLTEAGLGVLSEESGLSPGMSETALLAVLDPVDGSTNASRGIPWFATSICVLDDSGPFVALVVNQAIGARYEAVRGGGARRNGEPISPSDRESLGRSMIGLSGSPPRYLGWKQYRALGAAALDLCAVADGTLDGYMDCTRDAHGGWDYLGGLLVCLEAGAAVADGLGRDLVVRDQAARRTPVAGCTPALLSELIAARSTWQ